MSRKKKRTKEYFDKLYLNLIINDQYKLTKYIGHGKKGVVYKAYDKELGLTLACKLIPIDEVTKGWKLELRKMVLLRNIPNVVDYIDHGGN